MGGQRLLEHNDIAMKELQRTLATYILFIISLPFKNGGGFCGSFFAGTSVELGLLFTVIVSLYLHLPYRLYCIIFLPHGGGQNKRKQLNLI